MRILKSSHVLQKCKCNQICRENAKKHLTTKWSSDPQFLEHCWYLRIKCQLVLQTRSLVRTVWSYKVVVTLCYGDLISTNINFYYRNLVSHFLHSLRLIWSQHVLPLNETLRNPPSRFQRLIDLASSIICLGPYTLITVDEVGCTGTEPCKLRNPHEKSKLILDGFTRKDGDVP